MRNWEVGHDGRVRSLLVVLALAVGCTKPNPEVCCGDAADCNAAGIPEGRTCAGDLVCMNHSCEEPLPPECTESAQCTTATKAFCDAVTQVCRGCIDDTECDSGACGDDGACVAEGEVLYVSPTGAQATCSRAEPCLLDDAIASSTMTRFTYVFAPGTYVRDRLLFNGVAMLNVVRVDLHGHRARIQQMAGGSGFLVNTNVPTTMRDMELLANPGGTGLIASSALELQSVTVGGATAISFTGANLTFDRVVLLGVAKALVVGAGSAPTVSITNLLAYGTSDLAVDLGLGTGTFSHSTIANSGLSSSSDAQGIHCSAGVTLRAAIVWTPGGSKPPISGCTVDNVIAGPFPILGARATDPGFVSPTDKDFHLSPSSVARDAADEGPANDFEGDPRPQGARFDLGADEALP